MARADWAALISHRSKSGSSLERDARSPSLTFSATAGVIDQALAGSLGAVVALLGPGPIALLGDQFEGRLEEIGVEAD